MRQAVAQLPQEPDIFLNDAVIIPGISEEKQIKIIKGDAKSVSIAAASILAKVTRDHMMMEYDKIYPEITERELNGRKKLSSSWKFIQPPCHRN